MTDSAKVREKIVERGYWEIVLHPTEYAENRFDFTKLKEILEKHQVRYRGWPYPHIPNRKIHEGYYNKDRFVESFVHWAEYLENFRFYRSGQFIHYKGMIEDRLDDHPESFFAWTPEMQKDPPEQLFLEPTLTLYILTEILIFASKLVSEDMFGGEIRISIKLHNMNCRFLKSLSITRFPFFGRECHSETIVLGPVEFSSDSLSTEHDKLAIDWTMEILSKFDFTSEHMREILETDQKKFYERKL